MTAVTEFRSSSTMEPIPKRQVAEPVQNTHSDETDLKRPEKSFSRVAMLATLVLASIAFIGLFLGGWIPRQHQTHLLAADAEQVRLAKPRVRVTTPKQAPAVTVALLPGDVQAMEEIVIYPRTSGYVQKWHVDIGDEVEEGQLLAEISTPEVQAQVRQSEAALAESKATLERTNATVNLSTITTKRIRGLVAKNTLSQQDLDDAEGNQAVAIANQQLAEATIDVNKANLQRNQELLSFSEIRAPFAGTITSRNINTGQLVTQGNGTGQSLFQLARTNPVRVFVNVPQSLAPGVTVGLNAKILIRELPGRDFIGTVTRTAKAIDPLTRTLLTEIHVPNEDHALLVGSYAQVRMEVERKDAPLLIPATALIFNAQGNQVAVLDSHDAVALRPADVVGDFGTNVGIATGVTLEDRVVTNPGDRMSDGLIVEVDADPEPAASTKQK